MLQSRNRKLRAVAVLTGGVFAATAFFQPAPAQAIEKEKLYKGGAVALGVLGGYWILKGKTIPGAVAGAGAYYAYKKGQDAANDGRRNDYNYRNDRSSSRGNYDRSGYDRGGYNNRYQDNNYSRMAPRGRNGSIVLR